MSDPTDVCDGEPPTVLVVEDEPSLAELYTVWLSDSYSVETVHGGAEALEVLDERVDVVLLDRRMPGLSGDEVLESIREDGPDVRVVIVSAVSPDVDVIDMAVDEYLVKPADGDELLEVVERMVALADVEEPVRTLSRLVSTKATLEAQLSQTKLQQYDEYCRLLAQIDELHAAVEDVPEPIEEAFPDEFDPTGGTDSRAESDPNGEGQR